MKTKVNTRNSVFPLLHEELHYIIEEIPADRIGRPEEAAHLCSMLAEAPEYLTGQIITMDGAWT